ncbi:U-box domain-containing 35-like protein [Melia azedarach]|uniref:U-box domain-containing 35-like protein n=1 Tax=Melia azedarach TaxID=155640 RepID=A0ACC1X8T7_MELAZ|nr:U-box domain-containing 35-like protein [Melia azedarach]
MMEVKDSAEPDGKLELPISPAGTVAIAIKGNKESKYVVAWALEKFIPEGNIVFKLLHVRRKTTAVPTAMGNFIPIEQVRDEVADAYKKEIKWQTDRLLLPYKKTCAQRKVEVDVKVIESNDVAKAIAKEVANCTINKLVIGAAAYGMFTRKLTRRNLSSRISMCVPSFCMVYVVSNGKLTSIRPSDLDSNGSIKDDNSDSNCSNSGSSGYTSSTQTDVGSVASYSEFYTPTLRMQQFEALSTINKTILHTRTSSIDTKSSGCQSSDIEERKDAMSSCFNVSEVGQAVNMDIEVEKRGMYALAQNEPMDASRKVGDLFMDDGTQPVAVDASAPAAQTVTRPKEVQRIGPRQPSQARVDDDVPPSALDMLPEDSGKQMPTDPTTYNDDTDVATRHSEDDIRGRMPEQFGDVWQEIRSLRSDLRTFMHEVRGWMQSQRRSSVPANDTQPVDNIGQASRRRSLIARPKPQYGPAPNLDPRRAIPDELDEEFVQWLEIPGTYIETESVRLMPQWVQGISKPGSWLEDIHIDEYMYLLAHRQMVCPRIIPQRWSIVSTHLYQYLRIAWEAMLTGKLAEGSFFPNTDVERFVQGTRSTFYRPWTAVDVVYIPVNVLGHHWVACAVNFHQRLITVYDSAPTTHSEDEMRTVIMPLCMLLPHLMRAAEFYSIRTDIPDLDTPFTYIRPLDGVPHQDPGSGDCGVFTCIFIHYLTLGRPFDFGAKDGPFFRRRIAIDVWSGRLL